MSNPQPNVKYVGPAQPAVSTTYMLFDTTVSIDGVTLSSAALIAAARGYAFSKNWFALQGIHRFIIRLVHDQTLTLVASRSVDRGATWTIISTEAITAHAANSETVRDYLVEGFADWRLQLTNGGTIQGTGFRCSMTMSEERSVAA